MLPINQNQALFTVLRTFYGGNGITTFALPDVRGRVPIGAGQGAGLTVRPLGQMLGEESVSLTEAELAAHSHPLPTLGGMAGSTGGGGGHSEMQPSLALHYRIALNGIDPSGSDEGSGSGLDTFTGEVTLFAGSNAPSGWALADGSLLPIVGYEELFEEIGMTYGGNGTTHFALPDLRGRTAIGAGQGPGLSNRALGQQVGAESHILTTSELPAHSHTLPGVGGSTGTTGGGTAHSNMQPSLGLKYIIALDGIFPTQSAAGSGSGAQPFIGEIVLFAGNTVPAGWAVADGSELPIIGNESLWFVIGTTYGGDGQDTFALPDLRGRAALGFEQGPGLSSYALGQEAGVETVNLSVAQMGSHTHTFALPIVGDYNRNGTVDVADYSAWRDTRGSTTNLAADGDGSGTVDAGDYAVWRRRFGQTAGAGTSVGFSDNAVPEPGSVLLICVGFACAARIFSRPSLLSTSPNDFTAARYCRQSIGLPSSASISCDSK
jgi:microcystin-dependent protein